MDLSLKHAYIEAACSLAAVPGTYRRDAAQLQHELCDPANDISEVLDWIEHRPHTDFERHLHRTVHQRLALRAAGHLHSYRTHPPIREGAEV